MRSLLDINVILALVDPDHIFRPQAHDWWKANSHLGWASCPITENGVVRVMSLPNYRKFIRFSPGEIAERLRDFTTDTDQEFWSDNISVLDDKVFDSNYILGPKQITDIYLLALAVKNRGRLITFDQSISISAVRNAKAENLVIVK